MSLKQGTLVKYTAPVPDADAAAVHCRWDLKWTWDKIESNLIGIVLETKENKQVKVRWFGINKTFIEYERYLEIVKWHT